MLARLLLVLLLVAGAIPGLAAGAPCHESFRPVTAAMSGIPGHHDGDAPAEHRCPGCMPLPDAVAASKVPPATRPPLPRPLATRFTPRAGRPPATPPPRIG